MIKLWTRFKFFCSLLAKVQEAKQYSRLVSRFATFFNTEAGHGVQQHAHEEADFQSAATVIEEGEDNRGYVSYGQSKINNEITLNE